MLNLFKRSLIKKRKINRVNCYLLILRKKERIFFGLLKFGFSMGQRFLCIYWYLLILDRQEGAFCDRRIEVYFFYLRFSGVNMCLMSGGEQCGLVFLDVVGVGDLVRFLVSIDVRFLVFFGLKVVGLVGGGNQFRFFVYRIQL